MKLIKTKPSKMKKSNALYKELAEYVKSQGDESREESKDDQEISPEVENENEEIPQETLNSHQEIKLSPAFTQEILDQVQEIEEVINQNKAFKELSSYQVPIRGYDVKRDTNRWIDHAPDDNLDRIALSLINKVNFSQTMKKRRNPLKARKRMCSGFKEVLKSIKTLDNQK